MLKGERTGKVDCRAADPKHRPRQHCMWSKIVELVRKNKPDMQGLQGWLPEMPKSFFYLGLPTPNIGHGSTACGVRYHGSRTVEGRRAGVVARDAFSYLGLPTSTIGHNSTVRRVKQ